ncbi:MAG: hypothetical protein ABSD88_10785 [Candidatus Korobacteraceae bacterium]
MSKPTKATKRIHRPRAYALIAGLVVCIMLILADRISLAYGLTGSERIVDDICGGAIVGLLVYWYERARARYLKSRLKTIALMNHHVRNALQVIAYSANMTPNPERISQIHDAVTRIEWALREVLPGQSMDFDKEFKRFSD